MRVLVLGNYRQTITVVRSLGRAGHAVILGCTSDRVFTEFSNCITERWQHSEETSSGFRHELEIFLRNARAQGPIAVFPVGELQLLAVDALSDEAKSWAAWIKPEHATVELALDKIAASQLVHSLGIPVPPTQVVATRADILTAARALGFPAVLKRKDSSRLLMRKKAVICENSTGLEEISASPEIDGSPLLYQRQIPGQRINCHFAAVQGSLLSYFQQRVLRTDTPDGTGYGVESVSEEPSPKLRAYCDALTRQLRYSGVGCIQFMQDEKSKEFYFLEINPRLDASCALPYFCGVDFPKTALEIALGRVLPLSQPDPTVYKSGVRAHWLEGDLLGALHFLRIGELNPKELTRWFGKIAWLTLTAPVHLTWDRSDPKPFFYLFGIAIPIRLLKSLWRPRSSQSGYLSAPGNPPRSLNSPDKSGPSRGQHL